MVKDKIVFSIVRNGITNGYPFVESFSSWSRFCKKVVVFDGHSTDGTEIVLKELCNILPNFEFRSIPWPSETKGGKAIATFTDQAFQALNEADSYVVYVQADEIFDVRSRKHIQNYSQKKVLQFSRYVLFWNSFNKVLSENKNGAIFKGELSDLLPGDPKVDSVEWKSFRVFPPGLRPRSLGDGLSFDIGDADFECVELPVYHYGWCFPVNILQKHVSHARIYSDIEQYKVRGKIAADMLRKSSFNTILFDAMDPQYLKIEKPFWGPHLDPVHHLLPMKVYDPYVGLELLRNGVQW